jgi:hypothetical protein
MPPVSFANDIKPLFRPVDIADMKPMDILLDDYSYMSDPGNNYQNADRVQLSLSSQNGGPPTMPPGGPYWSAAQLALFAQWRSDGYQP